MPDLKHSEDSLKKEATIKQDLLREPAVREFTQSLWNDFKQNLVEQRKQSDGELTRTIEDVVVNFGRTILKDPALATNIDTWGDIAARYLIRTYSEEISGLVATMIENQDPITSSECIEIQIGKDLQFIRINGTLVGRFIGFVIHGIRHLLAMQG